MPTTGTMKYLTIGDSTYEVYNTDTEVIQTYAAASGYTNWRPLVVGYSSNSSETTAPTTITGTTYTFNTIKVKPSDGTIRFGAAALYNGDYTTTISADTLTAARTVTVPDKSGVMALTSDIPSLTGYAPLASPAFTGTPTAPTPLSEASDTQIATVKYVQDSMAGAGAGTVTSVGVVNATNGGLNISGSPITNSGTISVGHSNVLASAQTTSGIYPIKIDKNGHISEYGNAVNIPSKTSDLTNDSGFISSYTETDPVFSASAAAGITSTDISNWNAKVSDDKTWNGVELDKVGTTYGQSSFIPGRTSTSATTAYQIEATTIPNSYRIVKWDNDKYLYATTPSANDNSTKVATTAYVDSAITALPEPMIFKGSLGTGGTITSLPAASSSNEGFTYKVITAGTYASQSAKIGDTFISDGNNWILIPSGDEPSGTVTSITAGVGLTTADGNPITSSGTIKIKLNSETSLGTIGSTSKLYAVGVDSNGRLGVKVPWANDQVYTIKSSSSYVDMFLTGSTSSDTSTGYLYKDPSARLKVSDSSGETGLFLGDDITEGEKLGAIYLYSQSGIYTRLTALATTMVKYISLPDKTGIIALTDDIPSISLNGSSTTSASFYAPTTAGTSGYYLKSNGSGAPTWATIPAGVTVTLNGSTTTTPSFYAPTSAGTDGYVLKSNGSGAPTWTSAVLTDEKLKWTASTSSNTYYPLVSTSTATTSTANTLNGINFYQYYNTAGGYRRLDLGNSTAWTSTGGAYGTIRLYGAGATYYGDLVPGVLGTTSGDGHISANRTWTLPDKTGTIALTSDIPSNNVTGSGLTDRLAVWSGTKALSSTAISTSSSYDSSHDLGTVNLYMGCTGQIYYKGQLVFYNGSSSRTITITPSSLTDYRTLTLPDKTGTIALTSDITDEKLAVVEVTSGTTYYPIVGTGASAATRQYDTTGFKYSANSIRSFITLGNNISEGTTGSKRGAIQIYGTADRYTQLETLITSTGAGQNTGVVVYFPNKGGTIALTDDIPTVPTITLNGSSTTSPSFYAPTSAGTSGYYLKSNGSGAPTWAAITAPTKTSDLTNDSGFITSSALPTSLGDLTNDMNVSDFPNDAGYSTQTIYASTTAPTSSDGSNGDIWLVYEISSES